jgi:tripartite-type tricarboxylate transporter receptor subunit TctC
MIDRVPGTGSGPWDMMMRFPRRKFLHLAAAAATLPSLSLVASADVYPTRPIKIVVGFAAGGAVDIVARLIGQWLSDRIGQQCVVENRPGAGNNIATEYVLKSEPDGYTLLLTNPTNAINATYYENLPYDFIRDSAPVAGIMRVPNVMEVSPLLSAKTVPEFIALVKANPGKLAYATGGNGTSVHMSAELFKLMTETDILNVTYRGLALAYTDLMTNRVQVTFDNLPGSIGFIRQGKLRALAVTTTTRSPSLPDIPALAEFIPGYEASAFYGVSAPRKTPQAVIGKLNKEINAGLSDPALQARLVDLGGIIVPGSPADFGKLINDETEKWAKVIKFAGIKPE